LKLLLSFIFAVLVACVFAGPSPTQQKGPDIKLDAVWLPKDGSVTPAIHMTVFTESLAAKWSIEGWFPVLGLEDRNLSFGGAGVVRYSLTDRVGLYGGVVGKLRAGEKPIGGLIFGFEFRS
jgi:hypothetical protein